MFGRWQPKRHPRSIEKFNTDVFRIVQILCFSEQKTGKVIDLRSRRLYNTALTMQCERAFAAVCLKCDINHTEAVRALHSIQPGFCLTDVDLQNILDQQPYGQPGFLVTDGRMNNVCCIKNNKMIIHHIYWNEDEGWNIIDRPYHQPQRWKCGDQIICPFGTDAEERALIEGSLIVL